MKDNQGIQGEQSIFSEIKKGLLGAFGAMEIDPGILDAGLVLAYNCMQRQQYQKAFDYFSLLVLCNPKSLELQVGLADAALKLGEASVALQTASVVVVLAPRDVRGYLLSGEACLMLEAFKEAEEDFRTALDLAMQSRDKNRISRAKFFLEMARSKLLKHGGNDGQHTAS